MSPTRNCTLKVAHTKWLNHSNSPHPMNAKRKSALEVWTPGEPLSGHRRRTDKLPLLSYHRQDLLLPKQTSEDTALSTLVHTNEMSPQRYAAGGRDHLSVQQDTKHASIVYLAVLCYSMVNKQRSSLQPNGVKDVQRISLSPNIISL